jgi:kynureninase
MPERVRERLGGLVLEWDRLGVRAFKDSWWTMPQQAGDRVARLIGAPSASVTMHTNVSTAIATVLSCFDWHGMGGRTKVVASGLDFSTLLYACAAEERSGANLVSVPGDGRDPLRFDLERFVDAIDDDTAIVVLSAVLFRTSELLELAPVVARAKERGALTCVDLYQAAGTVPIDVSALGVDFAVGGSVKWLCGGLGAAYLYVAPGAARELEPRLTGWAAHEEPFLFAPPPQRYTSGIGRFQNGSPNVPALIAASAGHEILADVGLEAIRRKSQRQTARLVALCDAKGFRVVSPREPERRGGSITVDVANGEAVVPALADRGVLCDHRPGAGIRISPHFYTKDGEIDAAVGALEDAVRELRQAGRFETR